MRNILSYSKDVCCAEIQIYCPCSNNDLEYMVTFLYNGKIAYGSEVNLIKILNNLSEIFGFSKEQFLSENNKDGIRNDFDITKICFEEISGDDLTYGPKSNFGKYGTSVEFNLSSESQFEEEFKTHDVDSNFGKYETSSKIKEFEKSNSFLESVELQTYESKSNNENEETSMKSDMSSEFEVENNFEKHKTNLELKEYEKSNTSFEETNIATNKFDTNDMFVIKECENNQKFDFEELKNFGKSSTFFEELSILRNTFDVVTKDQDSCEDKPFKCERCKRSFKFQQQLDVHIQCADEKSNESVRDIDGTFAGW